MAIPKHEYFPTKSGFTTAKGSSTIFDNSVCFIEDAMEIYTHGKYWGVSSLSINYDSTAGQIQLKNGTTLISYFDASAFVRDGMVDSVELVTVAEQGVSETAPYLKFVFNTVQSEPTHSTIRVPIAELFTVYNGENVILTSNYAKAQTYTEPASNDSVNTAVGKLAAGVAANAAAILTKQAVLTGAATSIAADNLTASKALVSDANGKVAASSVTSTELGYLSGTTANIQTQLTNKVNITDISWVEH